MPQWIRPTTRWAIYLRDDLTCIYCRVTAAQMLQGVSNNFLSLDHFQTRQKSGADIAANLVTCCYDCNNERGGKLLRVWCTQRGWHYGSVRSRVLMARQREIERYRPAAAVLLGEVPGVPRADLVTQLSWRARRQFATEAVRDEWEARRPPVCGCCSRVLGATAAEIALDDEPLPF